MYVFINNILHKNNNLVLRYSGSDDEYCWNERLKSEKLLCPLSHSHLFCFSLSLSLSLTHTHTHTHTHKHTHTSALTLFFMFSGDIGSIGVMILTYTSHKILCICFTIFIQYCFKQSEL